eukprot:426991-Prorocentrum_minimum.AAC.1
MGGEGGGLTRPGGVVVTESGVAAHRCCTGRLRARHLAEPRRTRVGAPNIRVGAPNVRVGAATARVGAPNVRVGAPYVR